MGCSFNAAGQNSINASRWADSVFTTLNYEQKIGQLFMVDAYSDRDSAHQISIENLIVNYHIGGIIFFKGGPLRQAHLTNRYQSLSSLPLLIGIDGEWGLSMRLDSTIRFPRQMTLGAGSGPPAIYRMGEEIARQCKRLGIHLNFAPVADINNNPFNPVINSRSFGESREQVAELASAYMRGMQDHGVLACGKHFPGHGDTDADSHYTLPLVHRLPGAIDSVELYPFRRLISDGVASLMVAHLFIPSLDTALNRPATLSPVIVDSLLRKSMGFEGLIITDALNMKGVADFFPAGEAELLALKAGNDVLLYSTDVPKAWLRLHLAIQNCEIQQELIDDRVKRILRAKYRAGLNHFQPIVLENLMDDLNTTEADYLNRQLYENAITVIHNNSGLLPFHDFTDCRIASVVYNDSLFNPFQNRLSDFVRTDNYSMPRDAGDPFLDSLLVRLEEYDRVILSIHNTTTRSSAGFGISEKLSGWIGKLSSQIPVAVVIFGNAYTLTRMSSSLNAGALVLAFEDTPGMQQYTAQGLVGASTMTGRIPVTPLPEIKRGTGLSLMRDPSRLRFTEPMEMYIHPSRFNRIDSLAAQVIADSAAPGFQVLVAWKGNIIFQKSYGKQRYDSLAAPVLNTDLYDIASITKIAGTALAVMKLHEEGRIDIKRKASRFYYPLRHTNKRDLVISDILTHRAGLKAYIPFWKNTLENGKPSFNIYHFEKDVNYSVPVADSMFILKSYPERIWKEIDDSHVQNQGDYVYSDLGMLLMQRIVENISEQPLDRYLEDHFYRPLGLPRMMYNPLQNKIPLHRIVPTEWDSAFRQQLVHGYVHDPTAAMLGGVAGHAGLFSDAYSLAVIMQMLLNEGSYGGTRYFKPETVQLFTRKYDKDGHNRRGLIFDKPDLADPDKSPAAKSASASTFGHTGFTGTAAWADPEHDLIFIFLSNRVHPDASVNKLAKGNYRTDMMEAVYDIILNLDQKK